MSARTHSETGRANRRLVLGEIVRNRSISRTAIAANIGLNAATISRITRDLLDADLIVEKELSDPDGRRGRRFVQLSPQGQGGYIIGIGINAFRQSVTLADLENNKVASWEGTGLPMDDGAAFLELCAQKSAELVDEHVEDIDRFFGAGIAIAGHIDKASKRLISAPLLGWDEEIDVGAIFGEALNGPIALETPSSAINLAETTFGIARDYENVVTLHCSLVTGFAMTLGGSAAEEQLTTSSVLSDAPYTSSSDAAGPVEHFPTLEDAQSGRAFVREVIGEKTRSLTTDAEWGRAMVELVGKANAGDATIAKALERLGAGMARTFALLFTVLKPDLVILAGPLSESPAFVGALKSQIAFQTPKRLGDIAVQATEMTHIGAARWLSIRENLIFKDINLSQLLAKGGT